MAKALKASLVAEQALYHRQRVEFQEQAQKKKDLKRISDQFEQMKEKIRKAQKEHKAAEAVVTASEFKKTFSLAAVGQGKTLGWSCMPESTLPSHGAHSGSGRALARAS